MGAWGSGLLENDDALDWLEEAAEDPAPDVVLARAREVFAQIVSDPSPEVDLVNQVIAAATWVTCQQPEGYDALLDALADLEDGSCEALAAYPTLFCPATPEDRADPVDSVSPDVWRQCAQLAVRALDAAISPDSQWRQMWEEADNAAEDGSAEYGTFDDDSDRDARNPDEDVDVEVDGVGPGAGFAACASVHSLRSQLVAIYT